MKYFGKEETYIAETADIAADDSDLSLLDRLRSSGTELLHPKRAAVLAGSLALVISGLALKPLESDAASYPQNEAGLASDPNSLALANGTIERSETEPIDEHLYKQCETAALASMGQAGYRVLNRSKRIIEWDFASDQINPQCAKYGYQAVRFYAASFKPESFPKNPHRLGKTISFMNPTDSHAYHKRQTLSQPIPEHAILSDVETTVWVPKPGLGKKTKTYTVAGLQGAFN